jgi:hypothetical protein
MKTMKRISIQTSYSRERKNDLLRLCGTGSRTGGERMGYDFSGIDKPKMKMIFTFCSGL